MTIDKWRSILSKKKVPDYELDRMIIESDYWEETNDKNLLDHYTALNETLLTWKAEVDEDAREFYHLLANMTLDSIEDRRAWLKYLDTMVWIFITAALIGSAYFCVAHPEYLPKL